MRPIHLHRLFAVVFASWWFVLVSSGVAQESSKTGRDLPVRSGLLLWLDANHVSDAAASDSSPTASPNVATWFDRSGNHRDMSQSVVNAQPTIVKIGESSVVRFDGEADHMRFLGPVMSSKAITVFLVAAPHSNPGDFRGWLATNAANSRDYESGFNIDLGPGPTQKLSQLNIEGKGFGGAQNLLLQEFPFGTPHIFETVIDPNAQQVKLSVDGKQQSVRPYKVSDLSLEQWTLGARFYTHGPGDHQPRSPIAGDIAELIVFDRRLNESETESMRKYLIAKHESLTKELPMHLPKGNGKALVRVENPPAIQMLVRDLK